MATNLRLTDLGRNAILDDENVGTKAVQITKLALGASSGTGGADDDGRTTLRDQRDIVAATGSASVAGQIAVRAEFNSANAYAATEMGLFARIGAAGAEFLFAYWTDDGTVFINKPASLRTIVATTIALVRSAAAVEVTLTPEVNVGTVAAFLDLTDSPGSYVNAAKRKVVVKADGTGVEFKEGLLDHEAADDAETRAGALRTKAVTPAGLKAVVDDLVNGAPGALDTLHELAEALGDDPNFSATIMALVTARLTQDEVDARIRAIGGIGSLAFFSLSADVGAPGAWGQVLGGDVGPVAADDVIGLLVSAGGYGPISATTPRLRLTRGSTELTESFGRITTNRHWTRLLVLDKPGAAQSVRYSLEAIAAAQLDAVESGSSLAVLRMPSSVVADILTARQSLTDSAEILSVTITPPSATAKIQLRTYLPYASGTEDGAHRLLRGGVAIASGNLLSGKVAGTLADSFMDWVDAPATTNAVTYSIDFVERTGAPATAEHEIGRGAYLMASPLF